MIQDSRRVLWLLDAPLARGMTTEGWVI
jgi:hypothetical protein